MSQILRLQALLSLLVHVGILLAPLGCSPGDQAQLGPPHPILLVQASESDIQWARPLDTAFGDHDQISASNFSWGDCSGRSLVLLAKDALEKLHAPSFEEFESALAGGMQLILEAPPPAWADLGGLVPHGLETPRTLPWPLPSVLPRAPLRLNWKLPRYRPGNGLVRGESSPLGRPMLWRRDLGPGVCWTYAFDYGSLAAQLTGEWLPWRQAWDEVVLPASLPRALGADGASTPRFSFRRTTTGLEVDCLPTSGGFRLGLPLRDAGEVLSRWSANWPSPESSLHEESGRRWRSIQVPPEGGRLEAGYAALSP